MIRAPLLGLFCLFGSSLIAEEPPKAPKEFEHLKYRLIGPYAGGRVSRVAGVPGNPLIYYVATASGGVWKSENGGLTFQPIFDEQPIASIGSIAVSSSDPNVVYVGSGEANIRGNVAPGNGIYKSVDAGKTWKHVWKQVGQIGTMIVHPTNPDIAYAAVLGHAFGPNAERGIYRTKDGGKTWDRVLFKDNDTGASDICFDPNNPRILFAGLWQTRRKPWELTSGGPGGGLYISRDGGDTWKQLGPKSTSDKEQQDKDNGLPEGPYGKIAVAVAPSDSKRVYALIEAEKGGLYRSDDGGEKWSLASDQRLILQRIWYFGTLTVDPQNADVIYAPQVPMAKSIDGGKTFKSIGGFHHGDHHDLWIDPKNPKRMIAGNDGGVDITTDGGIIWYAPPLPISQFYHVACDNSVPYRVMGCMQDLGSASGPSNSLNGVGILLGDWYPVGGGEAGHCLPDPKDPNIIYAGEYGGYISRYDHRTRQARPVSIYPYDPSGMGGEQLKYRFQWTSPILISQHDSKVVYHAANVLFRTTDGGSTWQKISPDLTRNDKNKQKWSGGPITGDNTGVEIYCTIFAIAESPKNSKLLWAGSDDGLVHITRDGGKTWDNVTANIPDLPDWGTVKCIEGSHFDEGTAYLVVDAHRMDDYRPHVWKTTNFGKSWTKLTSTLPAESFTHVVREDPKRKGLLYLGTEHKVFFSWDDGKTWEPLKLNMPTAAIHDLVVKENDLVVGTHGRSVWILDNITPLREWSAKVTSQPAHLFPIQPTIRWQYGSTMTAHQSRVRAENPPFGALIQYYLKEKPKKPLTLEILNQDGKRVILLEGKEEKKEDKQDEDDEAPSEKKVVIPAKPGVNRFVWNLLHKGAEIIPKAQVDMGDPTVGPMIPPGNYTLNLTVDGKVYSTKMEILIDRRIYLVQSEREELPMPRMDTSGKKIESDAPTIALKDLTEQEKLALQLRDDIGNVSQVVLQIRAVQKQLKLHQELLKDENNAKELLKLGKGLTKKLDDLEAKLHNPKAQVSYDILAQKGGAKLYSQLIWLSEMVRQGDAPPTQGMKELSTELEKELTKLLTEFDTIRKTDLKTLNEQAIKIQAPVIWVPVKKMTKD